MNGAKKSCQITGVRNFRDFGEVEGRYGHIPAGWLFRSAHWAAATADDFSLLRSLQVRVISDLRRPAERESEPCDYHDYVGRVIISDFPAASRRDFSAASINPDFARNRVRRFYREVLFDQAQRDLQRHFLESLSCEAGAVLIHCTAGKDRTGVLGALTLLLLGADEEVVMADFLRSNAEVDDARNVAAMQHSLAHNYGFPIDRDTTLAFMEVRADHLAETIKILSTKFDGIEGYMRKTLGIGAEMLTALRNRVSLSQRPKAQSFNSK